jgi:acyl-CoA thioesterase YciA
MYGDLNPAQNLYGGAMMYWVDEAAAIFAGEKLGPGKRYVTLKFTEVLFEHPARLGDLLTFYAALSRTGKTSFDVHVSVHNQEKEIVSCDVTFVALDEEGNPTPHNL